MRPFNYVSAESVDAALQAAGSQHNSSKNGNPPATQAIRQFLAGGTNLLDLMKLDVMQPQTLIDINALKGKLGGIEVNSDGIRFSALTHMAQAAAHPVVLRDYPVIAETLKLAASAQLRNMASLGGNLLQRTRCMYFRDTRWQACNKREPGSGCSALEGQNRQHAVLGTSDACIASYPGDFAQAMIALDASVEIASGAGGASGKTRRLDVSKLHRLPGDTPQIETMLAPGELITAIFVPAGAWTRRSHYVKVRDRDSYQYAITSAAVALDMDGPVIREARIALGGVATVPWRAREAEDLLRGARLDEAIASQAGEAAFKSAVPHKHNAFKIELGKRTLARALFETAAMQPA